MKDTLLIALLLAVGATASAQRQQNQPPAIIIQR